MRATLFHIKGAEIIFMVNFKRNLQRKKSPEHLTSVWERNIFISFRNEVLPYSTLLGIRQSLILKIPKKCNSTFHTIVQGLELINLREVASFLMDASIYSFSLHQLKPEWYKVPAQAIKCRTEINSPLTDQLIDMMLCSDYRANIQVSPNRYNISKFFKAMGSGSLERS